MTRIGLRAVFAPAKPRDEVAAVRRRAEHANVGPDESPRPQPRRHGGGGARRAALLRGVDFDQLLENCLRQTLVLQRTAPGGVQALGVKGGDDRHRDKCR